MSEPQATWLCKGAVPGEDPSTWVLLVYNNEGARPEWRVAGHVVLRQVYESIPQAWFTYQLKDSAVVSLGHRQDLDEARELLRKAALR